LSKIFICLTVEFYQRSIFNVNVHVSQLLIKYHCFSITGMFSGNKCLFQESSDASLSSQIHSALVHSIHRIYHPTLNWLLSCLFPVTVMEHNLWISSLRMYWFALMNSLSLSWSVCGVSVDYYLAEGVFSKDMRFCMS